MKEEIKNFLHKANKSTYANKDSPKAASTRLRSEDYHFEEKIDSEDWIYHDTYWTGPKDYSFIGSEVIYKSGQQVWGGNYWGMISDQTQSIKEVYGFLREAMMQEYDMAVPVRGPTNYERGEWKYTFTFTGDLGNFEGEEKIYRNNVEIYKLKMHGGILI
jgi:hypothetical protein